jgi:cytochrome d ubiquinol oxidase subunit I
MLFYVAAYLVIYPTGVLYMLRIVRKGPRKDTIAPPVEAGRAALPVARLPSS